MSLSAKIPASIALPSPIYPIRDRACQRGELLPILPDTLWRIDSGFIRTVVWHYGGQAATLGIWGPGDFLGRLVPPVEGCQLECLTPAILSGIPAGRLPYNALHEATTSHLEQSQTLLNILHCRPISMRLMELLIWLAHRFGSEVERGWVLDLRLTHQAIAESIGTTRVTVTRMLQSFEREGRVKRLHHHRYFLSGQNDAKNRGLSQVEF
ncbi:Crp/Fnr family transcriptional regulator [Altericista sp. CCNU0014]|uniref:Crp/Fnr family transcriptional regulator n=1 Tax=Altericista sp. CCNU0014 TaxID=3082949 RepID=UPI00384FD3A1